MADEVLDFGGFFFCLQQLSRRDLLPTFRRYSHIKEAQEGFWVFFALPAQSRLVPLKESSQGKNKVQSESESVKARMKTGRAVLKHGASPSTV